MSRLTEEQKKCEHTWKLEHHCMDMYCVHCDVKASTWKLETEPKKYYEWLDSVNSRFD